MPQAELHLLSFTYRNMTRIPQDYPSLHGQIRIPQDYPNLHGQIPNTAFVIYQVCAKKYLYRSINYANTSFIFKFSSWDIKSVGKNTCLLYCLGKKTRCRIVWKIPDIA